MRALIPLVLSLARPDKCLDLKTWQALLPNDVPIHSVSLAGTHDSAASNSHVKTLWKTVVRILWQTQDLDISSQLAAGVRLFDFRINNEPDPLLFHGNISLEQRLTEVLQVLVDFVKENKSQFVVAMIKLQKYQVNAACQPVQTSLQEIVSKIIGDRAVGLDSFTGCPLVEDVRGRVLVIPRDVDRFDCFSPLQFKNNTIFRTSSRMADFIVQDVYNASMSHKKQAIVKAAQMRRHHQILISFYSGYMGLLPLYRIFSVEMETWLSQEGMWQGWLLFDFPSQYNIRRVVESNFRAV